MARQPRKPPRQPRKQMGVTLPSELRDRLQAAAGKAERSIGEEIRLRLERTFRQDAANSTPETALWRKIAVLAAVVKFATGRRWNEDPNAAYLLQLSIDRLLQHRYGASETSEISTTETFQREVASHTDPAQLALAIETLVNARVVIDRHLDEAYRRGGPDELERVALLMEDELDANERGDR